MPNLSSILARFTDTTILYWEKKGDDPFGKPLYATVPVEIAVRWEDQEVEVLTKDGRKLISHSYVLSAVEMIDGSALWLGSLTTWKAQTYYPTRPTVVQGLREIVKVKRTPGIRQLPGNVFEVYLL